MRRFCFAPRGCCGSGHDCGKSSGSLSPEHLRRPRRLRRAWRSRSARRRYCSANWHASAALLAFQLRDALFIDIGSTTADLIPIVAGRVAAVGYSDAERLASGELVYTGITRSFVMSLASRAPFRGVWTPLMNEYFASSADVHRILEDLLDGADKMPTADGREKTVDASRARLAPMIGREAHEGTDSEWIGLAAWFAEEQIRQIATRPAAPVPKRCPGRCAVSRLASGRPRGRGRASTPAILCRLFGVDLGPRGGLTLRARSGCRIAWRERASASVEFEVVVRQSGR